MKPNDQFHKEFDKSRNPKKMMVRDLDDWEGKQNYYDAQDKRIAQQISNIKRKSNNEGISVRLKMGLF